MSREIPSAAASRPVTSCAMAVAISRTLRCPVTASLSNRETAGLIVPLFPMGRMTGGETLIHSTTCWRVSGGDSPFLTQVSR